LNRELKVPFALPIHSFFGWKRVMPPSPNSSSSIQVSSPSSISFVCSNGTSLSPTLR